MEILKFKKWFLLLAINLSLVFIACSEKAKDIFNPTFQNQIEFSLSDKIYKMEEVVKRQSQIKVDSVNIYLNFLLMK